MIFCYNKSQKFFEITSIFPALPRLSLRYKVMGVEPASVSDGGFAPGLRQSPWQYESIPCGLFLARTKIRSPETASHSTRSNFRGIFRAKEAALLTQGNDDKGKRAEKYPRGATRFDSRHLIKYFTRFQRFCKSFLKFFGEIFCFGAEAAPLAHLKTAPSSFFRAARMFATVSSAWSSVSVPSSERITREYAVERVPSGTPGPS